MHINVTVDLVRNKLIRAKLREEDTEPCHSRCPLCDSDLVPFIRLLNRRGTAILERAVCAECSFVTMTRIPTQEWFQAFYGQAWDQRRSSDQIEAKLTNSYSELLEVVLPHLKSNSAKIFEIGVGYGACLHQFQKRGFKHLYGIEASKKRLDYAKNRFGFHLALTTSEKMLEDPVVMKRAPYDLVTAWHTLEHVFDLNKTLENISRLVPPEGLVFFGIPQFHEEHLFSLAHFLPHIHSFTRQSITTLLNKHGFRVLFIDEDIRVLAIKAGQPYQKTGKKEKGEIFEELKGKFERDLCLREILHPSEGEEDLLFLFSNGKPQNPAFKKSRQWVIPVRAHPLQKYLLDFEKVLGYGLAPMRPFVWNDVRSYNVRELLARLVNRYSTPVRWLKKEQAEMPPKSSIHLLRGKAQIKNGLAQSGPSEIPSLNICYPDDWVYTWVK